MGDAVRLFRTRPLLVQAEQFWPDQKPWPAGVEGRAAAGPGSTPGVVLHPEELERFVLRTPAGEMPVGPGYYITTGENGERWAMRPAAFEDVYEEVTVVPT